MRRPNPKKLRFLKEYSTDGKAALFTLGFTYLFILFEIVYKFASSGELPVWHIVLLFLIFAVFGIFRKLFEQEIVPNGFDGQPLPVGSDDASRDKRNAFYKKSARIYALFFSAVNLLALTLSASAIGVNLSIELFSDFPIPNIVLNLITTAIMYLIVYIFAYMIDYLWYENRIALNYEEEQPEENKETETAE